MRFEHGSHRPECLAATVVLLLLLLRRVSAAAPPPFGHPRQCLHLDERLGPRDACGDRDVRLRFCDTYELAGLLAGTACDAAALRRLRRRDEQARDAACRFSSLLHRYDCQNANSVSWTCEDCQKAYKQWVCAMYLPQIQMEGVGVKPCRYICRLVEQRCPYFHPSVKDQYAGERVFKCIDPDIPDLEIAKSSYGPPHRCYCPQHLQGEGEEPLEEECRLLSPAQLRRNASRSGAGRPAPPLAALLAAWWTRTR